MSISKADLLSRPSIAVDMDHVMADTGGYLCDWLNDRYGTDYSDEDFITLLDILEGDRRQTLIDHVTDGALMRDLPLMPDCASVLRELSERFAIVVCTASMEYPKTIHPKIDWLEQHFPFLESQLFVFCGYKQIMGTDYLIDDSPKHFKGFGGQPLLYTAPHNLHERAFSRVSSWVEIGDYFAS